LLPDEPENVTVDELIDSVPGAREQVAEARAKLKAAGGKGTNELHKLPNGSYTSERQAVHRGIVDKLMPQEKVDAARPAPGEKPTLHILGGRGGSGKGWFTSKDGTLDTKTAVYLNSDDVKENLPEWQGWNAGLLHVESGDVGAAMEKAAREEGVNVIIDATLKNGQETAQRIAAFKAAGYRIEGHYMYASPAKAAKQALGRFVRGNAEGDGKGRFVPPEYSLGSLTNEHSFDSQRTNMDYWEVYDNSGEVFNPQLHARGGKKK
jgi:predicted kinase